jgi:hypothetical protein
MTVFYTGNSGASTGPHLDLRVYNPATDSYEDPGAYTSYLTVGDNKDPFNFQITSGRGMREHPTKGGRRMHEGIDYATPTGTALNVNGKLLSTWNDEGGGGIMSQYLINTDDGTRELLLLHGSDANAITGTGALTEYDTDNLPDAIALNPTEDRGKAKAKAQSYQNMSKAQLDSAYDAMRSDPAKAETEGMKMHRAYFNKPKRMLG